MPFHDVGSLLPCGYPCPHRHEAAPYVEALYQTVVRARLPHVKIQVARIQRLDVRLLYRQQIEVHAIIEAVSPVPAVLDYTLLQLFGVALVALADFVELQASGQICHTLQFLIHQCIKENRPGAFVRTVEGARVIVHAYCLIRLPVEKSCLLVAVPVHVFRFERLEVIEVIPEPFGVAVHRPHYECGMLCECRLVHVALPWVALLEHLLAARCVALYPYWNPSVHSAVAECIEHTAFLIAEGLDAVFRRSPVFQNLA